MSFTASPKDVQSPRREVSFVGKGGWRGLERGEKS